MLCSMALPQCYVQHYMANLMLVQCVFASHAEVWTCQFGWELYQELTVTKVRSQKEQQCQLKVNILSQRKKVMLTKASPLSSHMDNYVCKLDNFFFTSQASKV